MSHPTFLQQCGDRAHGAPFRDRGNVVGINFNTERYFVGASNPIEP